MLTVREVADRHRVSVAFLTLALEKIGYGVHDPDSALPPGVVDSFESAYGDKIRAVRPAPDRGAAANTNNVAPPRVGHSGSRYGSHVMRVAHKSVTGARDSQGNRVKRLLENPGLLHAIDAAGTQDGDPWHGEIKPGHVHFYGGPIGTGPRAACGFIVRAVLGDEFVPGWNSGSQPRADQCPTCAALVADGKGFRSPRDLSGYDSNCSEYLRVQIDDEIRVKVCERDWRHSGSHRGGDGSEWDVGVDDYVPSPTEVGSQVNRVP